MTATRRGGRGESDASRATARGALLIAAAVIVGVVLLGQAFDSGTVPSRGQTPSESASGDDGDGENGEETTTTPTTTATTHPAAEVRVIVLNGGGPQGSAGSTTTALGASGFTTLPADNTADVAASVVYYSPTFEADAAAVATAVGITAPPQPMPPAPPAGAPPATDVDVVVVLGPDFTPVG